MKSVIGDDWEAGVVGAGPGPVVDVLRFFLAFPGLSGDLKSLPLCFMVATHSNNA